MWEAVTQNRRWKKRAKLWIFRKITKWRWGRHAPRLTATAVVTDSSCHFSTIWYVADVKNHRWWPGNPTGQSKFRNLRLFTLTRSQLTRRQRLRGWQRFLEIAQMACCQRQTHRRRWPGNPNGRSKCPNLHLFTYIYTTNASAPRLTAASGDRSNVTLPTSNTSSAMTGIDRSSAITKIYAYMIKQNLLKNNFLLLGRRYYDDIAHCFFLLSLATTFVLTYEK